MTDAPVFLGPFPRLIARSRWKVMFVLFHLGPLLSAQGLECGDRFLFHHEVVVTGTATLENRSLEPVSQNLECWGKAVVLESDPSHGWTVRYTFDRLLLDVTLADQGTCLLEILPGKVILDGTPVYDRERNSDLPVGLFDLLINEEFVVRFGPRHEVRQVREFRRNRAERSYFDLLSLVRLTWIPEPPREVSPGETWEVVRPLETLGGDFLLPATSVYRYNQAPTTENPVRLLQREVRSRLREPMRVPIRMGILATENLRFDALGPNLIAPPPDMKIARFLYESKDVLEFNTDWGFVQRVGSIAKIRIDSEVPPPDGVRLREKRLSLERRILLTVTRGPEVALTETERELWLGIPEPAGVSGAIPEP